MNGLNNQLSLSVSVKRVSGGSGSEGALWVFAAPTPPPEGA